MVCLSSQKIYCNGETLMEFTSSDALRKHYNEVHERLTNPPNAVPDTEINLKRRKDDLEPRTLKPLLIELKPDAIETPPAPASLPPTPTPPQYRLPSTLTYFSSVIQEAASEFGVTLSDLKIKSRKQHIVWPRQVAITVAIKQQRWSLPWIARQFGMDHTTAIHSKHKVEKIAKEDEQFRSRLQSIEQRVAAIPVPEFPASCCPKYPLTAPTIRKLDLAERKEWNDSQEPSIHKLDS